ncbi:MAG: uroporphyrinogen decarboxylase family protein [Candidatus Omnitrophota bacterium]
MSHRERVLLAINHKKTDRTPADFSAHKEVTDGLIGKLGVGDYEELLKALHVDMRRVSFDYSQPDSGPDADGYRRNMWGVRWRESSIQDGKPNWISPFDENTTVEDVHRHPWPDPNVLDYSGVTVECEKYHQEYATFGAPWSPFFHEAGWVIGQENLFIWMSTKPDVVSAIIDRLVDYEIEATRGYLEACRGMLDITYFGNDYGTQRGLFISPQSWQKFIRQPQKRYFDISREYGCKVMLHSCGGVRSIIPMLIEDGVDILDPIQVAAKEMELAGLVKDFGHRLAFHGGVDTQSILPFGIVADVRSHVRSYINLTRDSGGYILCGSQEYIEDIPLDNILAIYEENARNP